jgi:hypothetical protein
MSAAEPIAAGDDPSPCTAGVVAVLDYRRAHLAAMCTCGWRGGRRYLRAMAVQDAWEHSILEKCLISRPLVMRVSML